MGRYSFFVIMALAVMWVVLTETLSWQAVAVGMIIAVFCVFFSDKFLPDAKKEADRIKFSKLIFYPFYLIGQVYLAGFSMLKFVITGAKFSFVPVKTTLKSEALKVLLMDSMTLVPGSVSVDLKDDTITSLWIFDKKLSIDELGKEKVSDMVKANLEKKIKRAEILDEVE